MPTSFIDNPLQSAANFASNWCEEIGMTLNNCQINDNILLSEKDHAGLDSDVMRSATDKMPKYEMPLIYVFGGWDFWGWGKHFLYWGFGQWHFVIGVLSQDR